MFSSVNYPVFYFLALTFTSLFPNFLFSKMVPPTFLFVLAHLVVTSLCLLFRVSSHPSITTSAFLSLHPSLLPSGRLGWCDAGCECQRYMRYRVGGGGPGVWALWQRQQVPELPDVCLYPQICPPDTSHFLPKYITESFLFSTRLTLSTASHQI